jgi:hypothetical protein
MADEGAVFTAKDGDVFDRPYLGTAALDISKAMPQSVLQGYSFYLPFQLEM